LANEALGGEEYTPSVVATIVLRESAAASVVSDISSDMHEQSLRGEKSTPHVAVSPDSGARILSVLFVEDLSEHGRERAKG
jgi:hypothetical protein